MNPAASGLRNERLLQARLRTLRYNGLQLTVSEVAGSNKAAPDITVSGPISFTLETKTKTAAEGGGSTMRYKDGAFQLPDNPVLRSWFPLGFQLWEGRIPACVKGDRSIDTWMAEKEQFKAPPRIPVSASAVAEYYRQKGTLYVQIEGRGVYHTGEDVHNWGVPKFEPQCTIRIRLKQHHSTSVPQDVQACFNYKIQTLPPSPYDFMDTARLPPGFTEAEE